MATRLNKTRPRIAEKPTLFPRTNANQAASREHLILAFLLQPYPLAAMITVFPSKGTEPSDSAKAYRGSDVSNAYFSVHKHCPL